VAHGDWSTWMMWKREESESKSRHVSCLFLPF